MKFWFGAPYFVLHILKSRLAKIIVCIEEKITHFQGHSEFLKIIMSKGSISEKNIGTFTFISCWQLKVSNDFIFQFFWNNHRLISGLWNTHEHLDNAFNCHQFLVDIFDTNFNSCHIRNLSFTYINCGPHEQISI